MNKNHKKMLMFFLQLGNEKQYEYKITIFLGAPFDGSPYTNCAILAAVESTFPT